MPQKYGAHMVPINGYQAKPETLKEVREMIEARREKTRQKKRQRQFAVEPEELKVLEAIERMPDGMRQDAAEGALIARVAKRKGLIR